MRPVPSRYLRAEPALTKKVVSQVAHLAAPLKGLSLDSTKTTGDPNTATVLRNFVIENDRIQVRAGFTKLSTHAAGQPIWHLVPYYGQPVKLAAATNNTMSHVTTGVVMKSGFTGDDWHWTSFSNLSSVDFTVMVNGHDGVWSWDGGDVSTDPAPVAVTHLSKSVPPNYAVITVASGDIGKFNNGDIVMVAGASGNGYVNANGPWAIASVNSPANTFQLIGVDTSTATLPEPTTGITVDPPGTGFVKETVTASLYDTWINPSQFAIVQSHMNRLFFADSSNLAIYYLPLQQKSGVVRYIPLNAVFRRGGSVRAMYTWTMDGGRGMEDTLAIFSTNGECVIYGGVDPDSDFTMIGVFRFDSPMSKHSVVNWGGDLYAMISTGLVPLSTMLRAESEQLGIADRNVVSAFRAAAIAYRAQPGWMAFLNPSTGRMICNIPQGGGVYKQLVRHMPNAIWSEFAHIPARCWAWQDPFLYFGDEKGSVYQMHPMHRTDAGAAILADVQTAWSLFKSVATKQFKMVYPHIISDGTTHPMIDMRVDYNMDAPINQPDIVTVSEGGALWDEAIWDVDYWEQGIGVFTNNWSGVSAKGRIGAVSLSVRVENASFAIAGFDVLYETGSAIG